jgi:Ca-activated chloride channel homolog
MKKLIWVILCFGLATGLKGQFYLRGEIRNEQGRLLPGVKIQLASKGSYPYYSGISGTFGISTQKNSDTITLQMDGYEMLHSWIDTRKYQNLTLKMLPTTAHLYNPKLLSATTHLTNEFEANNSILGESYSNLVENSFIASDKYPETGFAINIDKASYSNLRRFLSNDMQVPVNAIRIEELLNYFDYSLPSDRMLRNRFSCRTRITECPWQQEDQLLFINLTAPQLPLDSIPPSNLVFLIDISGSMDKPNRLPLLQSAFNLLVNHLRKQDTITVVTYGGGVGIALPPTSGDQKQKIRNVIDSLEASGDTPGENAIRIAYDLAKKNYIKKGNNRVILATDGDFNVGQSTEKELEDLIMDYKQSGIYLTCLGVGMGNYKDSKLETLAKKGNGNFGYIDHLAEAEKMLVTEFTQTLYTVANNCFVKIRFQPHMLKSYRLIGFDNVKNAAADSANKLEGGEVGSGHSMMAIFELKPSMTQAIRKTGILADLQIQYKKPHTDQIEIQTFPIPYLTEPLQNADSAYRLAATLAMFGGVLKKSPYINGYSLEDVYTLGKTAINPSVPLQEELLHMIEAAIRIYEPDKKRKKK